MEILHEKRMEVAMLHILGHKYAEIEKKTGISHGSISNIVKELQTDQLIIPGVSSDEVNYLHQLSVVLTKNGLEPSQAMLGINMYKRFTELGIVPSQFDQWSKLVMVYAQDD